LKSTDQSPLFDHPLEEETEFRPEELLDAVRILNGAESTQIPSICVLDFDGDLVDALEAAGLTTKSESWACFHTAMQVLDVAGIEVGIVGRTIGGPYAVLIAEQMAVSGAEVIVGLSSAGRVSTDLALPSLVVPTKALRDEGTSLHYIAPSRYVYAPEPLAGVLAEELVGAGLPVERGAVWTTDAPYRETASQIQRHANEGILAVEMQAASLFAFGQARGLHIGEVVHVTNATDNAGENFDKGADDEGFEILKRIARAGARLVHSGKNGRSSRSRSSLG
jgi:uridine phosphorylase